MTTDLIDEMNAAWQELHRPKVGRRARITGQVGSVQVHDALPSQNRMLRQHRAALQRKSEDGGQ